MRVTWCVTQPPSYCLTLCCALFLLLLLLPVLSAAAQESGVDYSDMLFFDNERWNITGGWVLTCVLTCYKCEPRFCQA